MSHTVGKSKGKYVVKKKAHIKKAANVTDESDPVQSPPSKPPITYDTLHARPPLPPTNVPLVPREPRRPNPFRGQMSQ